jgi:putative membrane protein
MGYSSVGELRKDDQGVWRGRAVYGGQQVNVGVDYRGAITRN